jgi:hypothetical protein
LKRAQVVQLIALDQWYPIVRQRGPDLRGELVQRVLHIRNSKSLDDGPEDEKAIEDRLADIQKAASRKFDLWQFASTVMQSNRIIKISPTDLDD